MKIVIPDDYQDIIHRLDAFRLLDGHEVTRYRTPARDLDELVERLLPAEIVVEIRERIHFSRALIERLAHLRLSSPRARDDGRRSPRTTEPRRASGGAI